MGRRGEVGWEHEIWGKGEVVVVVGGGVRWWESGVGGV